MNLVAHGCIIIRITLGLMVLYFFFVCTHTCLCYVSTRVHMCAWMHRTCVSVHVNVLPFFSRRLTMTAVPSYLCMGLPIEELACMCMHLCMPRSFMHNFVSNYPCSSSLHNFNVGVNEGYIICLV